MHQVPTEDVFGPSLGRVWMSWSKVKVIRDKKTAFLSLLAACVQFVFGKTSLASCFHWISMTEGSVCLLLNHCCCWVHLQAVCLQPFYGNVQSLQPRPLQLGLWAAVDNMSHRWACVTRVHVGCCKTSLLLTGCIVALVALEAIQECPIASGQVECWFLDSGVIH